MTVIEKIKKANFLNKNLDEVFVLQQAKELRYKRLEQIFKHKWLGIQAIAIDKAYITDKETIQAQIDSYGKLYQGALKILENEPDNESALTIKNKYETTNLALYSINLLMQQIRGLIEAKIEATTDIEDIEADRLLDIADSIKLTKEDLEQEGKIEKIKELFYGTN